MGRNATKCLHINIAQKATVVQRQSHTHTLQPTNVLIGYVDNTQALYTIYVQPLEWLGSRVVSVLDSGAEGLGSNRSRDAVG